MGLLFNAAGGPGGASRAPTCGRRTSNEKLNTHDRYLPLCMSDLVPRAVPPVARVLPFSLALLLVVLAIHVEFVGPRQRATEPAVGLLVGLLPTRSFLEHTPPLAHFSDFLLHNGARLCTAFLGPQFASPPLGRRLPLSRRDACPQYATHTPRR